MSDRTDIDMFSKKKRKCSEVEIVPPPLPRVEKDKEKRIIQTDEDLNQVRVFVV